MKSTKVGYGALVVLGMLAIIGITAIFKYVTKDPWEALQQCNVIAVEYRMNMNSTANNITFPAGDNNKAHYETWGLAILDSENSRQYLSLIPTVDYNGNQFQETRHISSLDQLRLPSDTEVLIFNVNGYIERGTYGKIRNPNFGLTGHADACQKIEFTPWVAPEETKLLGSPIHTTSNGANYSTIFLTGKKLSSEEMTRLLGNPDEILRVTVNPSIMSFMYMNSFKIDQEGRISHINDDGSVTETEPLPLEQELIIGMKTDHPYEGRFHFERIILFKDGNEIHMIETFRPYEDKGKYIKLFASQFD